MNTRITVATLMASMLLVGACSNDDASPPTTMAAAMTPTTALATTEPPTTPTRASEVTVVEDLVYRATEPNPWMLDVYYSPTLEGGPVVVFFHGGGMDKSHRLYEAIAEATAFQGAVVFVPDWNDIPADDVAGFLADFDSSGCAVSYALAHASEYGANPEWLVLAGHSGGAIVAQAAGGLRQVSPVADCVVKSGAIEADRLVLWDGDWLMGDPTWDRYGTDIPLLIDAFLPWSRLEYAPKVPVVFATASETPATYRKCGVDNPESLHWVRDPDGWFQNQLNKLGMLDDGCIDNGEVEELLAQTMQAHGFDAIHLILDDSYHVSLSEQGQTQLVETILTPNDR